jgi:hypothetical protein
MARIKTVGSNYDVARAWASGATYPNHTASNKYSHADGVLNCYRDTLGVIFTVNGERRAVVADLVTGGGRGSKTNHGEFASYCAKHVGLRCVKVSRLYSSDTGRIQNEETREEHLVYHASNLLEDAREEMNRALLERLAIPYIDRMRKVFSLIVRANGILSIIDYGQIPLPPTLRVHEHVYEDRTAKNRESWIVRETMSRINYGKPMRKDKYGRMIPVDTRSASYGPRDSVGRAVECQWSSYALQYPDRCRSNWMGGIGEDGVTWWEWLKDAGQNVTQLKIRQS